MKKIEFAAARPYAAPSCKLVKMMPRSNYLQAISDRLYGGSGASGNKLDVNDYGDGDEYDY